MVSWNRSINYIREADKKWLKKEISNLGDPSLTDEQLDTLTLPELYEHAALLPEPTPEEAAAELKKVGMFPDGDVQVQFISKRGKGNK